MNATANITDAGRLGSLLMAQRAAFLREGAPSLAQRRADLAKFRATLIGHRNAIEDAINSDFGHRSRYETAITEVGGVAEGTKYLIRFADSWHRPAATLLYTCGWAPPALNISRWVSSV
ncbi:hypothetical protein [Sinorhizobium meliloti]|uniref:hypothetical protein n=1 Tax=Rhizobium meliloti TaxID=382 RepID=UPI001F451115|nr:hypothetical protein [Sinorhizobium meliloti]